MCGKYATVQSKEQMKARIIAVLRQLQHLPEIVASFFHAPTYRYAMG